MFFFLAGISQVVLPAQHIGPAALVSTGGHGSSTAGSLSWTVGQLSGATFLDASGMITAGVQQPDVVRLALNIRAFLDGPYDASSGLMHDALRAEALIPLSEPYTAAGLQHAGDGGGEQLQPALLAVTGPDAVVDWVLVELRSSTDPTQIVSTRCGLLQRDGDIVDLDGTSPLRMKVQPGDYRIAVRHRNHLGLITAGSFSLGAAPVEIDMTVSSTLMAHGAVARKQISGPFPALVLWGGNANGDQSLSYYGSNSDRQSILNGVGSGTPFSVVSNAYDPADVNMDGILNYYGSNSDRQFVLNNVGSSAPFGQLMIPLE
jgi:hypothetical protein